MTLPRTSTVITSKGKHLPLIEGNTMQGKTTNILHNPGNRLDQALEGCRMLWVNWTPWDE